MKITQQLEDKKKGCGCSLRIVDLGLGEELFACNKNDLCRTCQAEIAILEQAIAEIENIQSQQTSKEIVSSSELANADISNLLQKQRQDFERLIDEVKNNEFNEDKTKELAKIVPEWSEGYYKGINNFIQTLKQQLNQPKTK